MTCLWDTKRQKAIDGEPLRLRANQAGGTTIGKDEKREYLLQLMSFLKMQSAELQVQNQNGGVRFRANNMMRRLESVYGGVASHEADHGSFHRRRKSEMVYDLEIQPRRVEPRA